VSAGFTVTPAQPRTPSFLREALATFDTEIGPLHKRENLRKGEIIFDQTSQLSEGESFNEMRILMTSCKKLS